jgi:hypothetical protein
MNQTAMSYADYYAHYSTKPPDGKCKACGEPVTCDWDGNPGRFGWWVQRAPTLAHSSGVPRALGGHDRSGGRAGPGPGFKAGHALAVIRSWPVV